MYAAGLVLIWPLGDVVRRSPLLLLLIFTSGSLTIGLALTRSLDVLQVLIPFTANLAPPNRRAFFMSVVFPGLHMGILLARVLPGIIAQYSSYRNIFCVSTAGNLWLWAYPPSKLEQMFPPSFWPIYTRDCTMMNKFAVTEPALILGCLIFFLSSVIFGGFCVTMTFRLGGAPYHYSTCVVFGGMVGISMTPFIGRVVDGLVTQIPFCGRGTCIDQP
ncbi:hypothetical protein B0H19DRAFT_971548 [Mycena capillaripes]|nr:hypothetical protein B0H19DRAFT_971548 [Mycena capillaripes]